MTADVRTPVRSGSVPAHEPTREDLERLAGYPHVVVSWIDDAGYPTSVATGFEVDAEARTVTIAATAEPIPTDREINVLGSHIRPQPGVGYDQRRYLQLWGRLRDGRVLRPTRAWGWDENEVPFFEYSERSVPQSRKYLAQLSEEKGRPIRPRLSPFWLALRTTRLPFLSATAVPVLLGIAVAAHHGFFTWWTALLTLIGGSLAHLAINVTNDIFDTLSGADEANTTPTQFSGGSRVAIYDLVTIRGLAKLAIGLFGAAAVIGLALVAITGSTLLLWIGVAGIVVGVAYTAPPLKLVYRGLGEFAVALGFGPIMLLGAYVVQTGRLAWEPFVVSLVPGILIALILYVNEIPDRRSDAVAGKRTLPVRFSPEVVRTGYLAGAIAAFAIIVLGVAIGLLPWPTLIALAAVPLALRVHQGLKVHYDSPYTLMAVMGTNVNLNLVVGGLLLVAYVATIVTGLLLT
ncbi:MAG TPA: prenyltransferase [Candidatus Limnocylindrales bacterium]|jgi:1,4-dihydroxy-2-naphthoate polyprenyltransferase|nr:prenyltransferase [Candidatus Limnocylindrales bacterium]